MRPALGDGGVIAIGQPDDQIRVSTAADKDDLDLLSVQRVMRMGDGHPSRDRLQCLCSLFWASPPGLISSCKR